MIVSVSRQPADGIDQHVVHSASVVPAEVQKLDQLGSVGGLGALSFLYEDGCHGPTLRLCELPAPLLLRLKAQVRYLLLGADAAVHDAAAGHALHSSRARQAISALARSAR